MHPSSQMFCTFLTGFLHHRLRLLHRTQFRQRVSDRSVTLAVSCSSVGLQAKLIKLWMVALHSSIWPAAGGNLSRSWAHTMASVAVLALLQVAANATLRSKTLRRNCVWCINCKWWCKKPVKKVQNVCDDGCIKHGYNFSCVCDVGHTIQFN